MATLSIEQLPDKILLKILKYLSFYDAYKALHGLNSRFESLLYRITPKTISASNLEDDMLSFERHQVWYIGEVTQWNESLYCLVPILGCHAIRWEFLPLSSFNQLTQTSTNYRRISPIVEKYVVRLNCFLSAWSVDKMKHLYFDSKTFPNWMKENYSELNKIIIDSNSGWYTKEVCNAFEQINELEKTRQKTSIRKQAQMIWNELRESQEHLFGDIPSFP